MVLGRHLLTFLAKALLIKWRCHFYRKQWYASDTSGSKSISLWEDGLLEFWSPISNINLPRDPAVPIFLINLECVINHIWNEGINSVEKILIWLHINYSLLWGWLPWTTVITTKGYHSKVAWLMRNLLAENHCYAGVTCFKPNMKVQKGLIFLMALVNNFDWQVYVLFR